VVEFIIRRVRNSSKNELPLMLWFSREIHHHNRLARIAL
jgi:hypothetical protein